MRKQIKKPRVRIAPSPTGPLHIGTARTALFNYLFARKHEGKFVLRIEDTDPERSKKEFEKDIIENLKWLGIEWDEGPDIGGKYGPYRQSERREIYKKYLEKLISENKAYFCFCSLEDLKTQREYLLSIGQPPRYTGKCRNLSQQEVKKLISKGKKYVIRFKMPSKKIVFDDLIRGKIEYQGELIGDIVLAKDFYTPLYNFACVVDDYEMKITHVIRGEDHISNTPKQIALQKALGFPTPKYAHLPLILGPDKSKLSKRHGAVSISQYKKEGYLPEAIVNFIAFLGWNPGTEREIYSIYALIKDFSLERVQKSGAVFNIKKLDYLNGFYIRQKSPERLTDLCIPYLREANFIEKIKNNEIPLENQNKVEELKLFREKFRIKETGEIIDKGKIKKIVILYQERLKKLSEIVELTDFFFKKELKYNKDLLRWKNMTNKEIFDSLDRVEKILLKIEKKNFNSEKIKEELLKEAEKMKDRGKILWPFRVALTGKEASAGPFEIAEILGKEKTIERIKKAKEKIKI